MYNLEINIGLNVGLGEPKYQGFHTMTALQRYFEFGHNDFEIDKGQWIDEESGKTIDERVLKVRVNVGRITKHAIRFILSNMALDLEQDAIAFVLNGEGSLAFSPLYLGEQYEFNPNYFKVF